MNEKEGRSPDKAPPSSCTLAPLSFRVWLAAKLRLTAGLLALRLAGLDLRFLGLDLHPAGLDLRLAELSLTSTLLV